MGRMVLSAVHTNSAFGAVDRLLDLDVPPFLLAATLRGVLAQRLVRRLCPHCAVVEEGLPRPPGYDGIWAPRRPAGCPDCRGKGYVGRLVISELAEIDRALAERIAYGETAAALETAAIGASHVSLSNAGLPLAGRGEVCTTEVVQAVERT